MHHLGRGSIIDRVASLEKFHIPHLPGGAAHQGLAQTAKESKLFATAEGGKTAGRIRGQAELHRDPLVPVWLADPVARDREIPLNLGGDHCRHCPV